MLLEELLLQDYGTFLHKIGTFLLKNNSSTLDQIQSGTGFTRLEVVDGLSVLIQRRFVKFFIFEKIFKYTIYRQIIKKRLYFPVYLNFISSNYTQKHVNLFSKVLSIGTSKEMENNPILEELILADILKIEPMSKSSLSDKMEQSMTSGAQDGVEKVFKASEHFLIVNFDFLDQKIFEVETIKLVQKKYNEAAATVLRSVLKCDVIDRPSIIKNLESTKILISDNGSIINEKDNIIEYLKYICASGILVHGYDERRAYFLNTSRSTLKSYRIVLLLKEPAMRRVFRMIYEKGEIEDKNIRIHSLLGVNRVKTALLSLQRLGLVTQKCLSEYSSGPRVEHSWSVDMNMASLSMIKRLEDEMVTKLKNINSCWDGNYLYENSTGNSDVWTSDLIALATDHLILSIDIF